MQASRAAAGDRVSRVIFDYAARIGGAAEPEALLRLNADMARDLVGADRCSIWLIDGRTQELWTKVAHGVEELRIPLTHGLVGAAVASNELILVNDTAQDARFAAQVDRKSGYATKSVLVMPLRGAGGTVIGALQLLNKEGGFQPEDVELVGLAASYSASAIETQRLRLEAESARLMKKELEIARSVQQRLLPQQWPARAGLEYGAYCRPAKFVGGDYYDFIGMPEEGLFFTLGDVSGKGVAAAVLMASIQAALRTQVVKPPLSLAALMNDFNRAVYSFSTSDKYSTLFAGYWLGAERRLRYVNAGGCPPMLWRAADGAVQRLDEGGCPVGLIGPARYQEAEVRLEAGDVVLCYSDGISEATNAREEIWEESELERVLAGCAGGGVESMIEAIVGAADGFTGEAEQADDMTVVVLKAL